MVTSIKKNLLFFIRKITQFSPRERRIFLICFDVFLVVISIFLAFLFSISRNNYNFSNYITQYIWLFQTSIIFSLIINLTTGQYKALTRFVGTIDCYKIFIRNLALVFSISVFGSILRFPLPHISELILIWILLNGFITFLRFGLKDLLINRGVKKSQSLKSVAIYGAGEAGAQLCLSLQRANNYKVLFFLDDNPILWGRYINGIKIFSPDKLEQLNKEIEQVLLAIPSLSTIKRKTILKKLVRNEISVLEIPSLNDLTIGTSRIDKLKPIKIEDLLGRDTVLPCQELLGPGITDANVCITGAGGTIGSEICKQIAKLNPSSIIIIDHSEYSLYLVEQTIRSFIDTSSISLIPILGSCLDKSLIKNIFSLHSIDIVFHAAAYKHVPLVEMNPLVGIENNVLSTRIICEQCLRRNVKKFVLISSDKAVRPSNVMGASKRLSELIVQAFANESETLKNNKKGTIFSMVRFGNVLGSSGSVVPRFQRQIANGGPITLTHEKVIRYFMTIEEAALLVIQSSVLSIGGDVFLLDMGKPVLIKDLAIEMINLSGLTLKDNKNPKGDIEIKCTGLRPGEKLYEELLIENNSISTKHSLIYRANELSINPKILWPMLDKLEEKINLRDNKKVLEILKQLVPEWSTNL